MPRDRRTFQLGFAQTRFAGFVLCLTIGLTQGCARPDALHHKDAVASSPAGEQTLPFHQNSDRESDDSARPAVPSERKSATSTPFHASAHSRTLPAGTLITVLLENSIAISRVRAGDSFTASVAGPLMIDGDTLVAGGTPVSGRVESIQPSADRPGLNPDPGYLRLTLAAITVDGRALSVQTSSLFAKGTFAATGSYSGSAMQGSNGFGLTKGRRLTFRLIAPITLADPRSVANLHYSNAPNQ